MLQYPSASSWHRRRRVKLPMTVGNNKFFFFKKGGRETVVHFHDLETGMAALAEKTHLRCAIKNLPEKRLALPASAGEVFGRASQAAGWPVTARCQVKSGKVFEKEVPAWMHPGQ